MVGRHRNALILPPQEWAARSACQRVEDPNVFWPIEKNWSESQDRIATLSSDRTAKALEICGRCPVTKECLDWAISHGEDKGIWGGKTAEERRVLTKKRTVK